MSSGERVFTACLIIIGNEILSGRTEDRNLAHMAKRLNDLGVRMQEARVIPDIEETIIETVNECREKFDYVFTTGGIGPTHDDITAETVAKAFGVDIHLHPEAVGLLTDPGANAERHDALMLMARVPVGATLIDNPISRAPGFQIGNVFVLAGVPAIMKVMLESARHAIQGGRPVQSRTVSVYLGESQISRPLRKIQDRYPEIDVGSYPFFSQQRYGTSLVMRGVDEDELAEVMDEVRHMIRGLDGEPIDGEIE